MLRLKLAIVFCFLCIPAFAQTSESDAALLKEARALYDAPFARNLASFDCTVQFDWKQHIAAHFEGTVPEALLSTSERLQSIQHRVSVSPSGVIVASTPESPEFAGDGRAAMFEHALDGMISGGMQAWLPFSTGTVFPVGLTKYDFVKLDSGYKLTIHDPVHTTEILDAELRVTSGVVEPPQDARFVSKLEPGPDGLLLKSASINTISGSNGTNAFAYTYQTVDGIQLPSEVTVSPATTEPFHFALTSCKVVKFVTVHVAPPSAH
jgi:hypothetical protein